MRAKPPPGEPKITEAISRLGDARDRARGGVTLAPESVLGCELLRIVFNSISDGVFTVDRDMKITSFNQAAERITGFRAAEAVGRLCYEIFRTDVCHRQCALRAALNDEDPQESARVHIITHEGVEKPLEVRATVLREDARVIGAVEFFRDLSAADRLQQQQALGTIVSGGAAMNRIIETLPNIARSDCNVLIVGPSGSGKELVAHAIHSLSPRRYGPYIKINCAALPATLLESELFGYAKGAFTDARHDKPGHFSLANGGTLLLDEISEMEPALQVKLLRVLNDGEYQPLGSTKTLHSDARVIAATNADIPALIDRARFRADLYFRLNVVTVKLPSLRERTEDIPLLTNHFVNRFRAATGRQVFGVSPQAMRILVAYSFPGNVRELENAIEHAFVMCGDEVIGPNCLPHHIVEAVASSTSTAQPTAATERDLIRSTLERCRGNRTLAARELGMHRTTLWRKLKGLDGGVAQG